MDRRHLSADTLVVGGGAAGIAAALTLAHQGLSVLLVERSSGLGGRAAGYACMATTRCRRCSACLVEDSALALRRLDGVEILLSTTIAAASRMADGYSVDVECGSTRSTWKVRGAILCTGFDAFDAAAKPLLGHGKLDGVVTTLELDRILKEAGDEGWSTQDGPPRRVAFVQCVGSRESREGRGYCSQVCCSAALRLAGKLAHLHPEVEITIFYIDLQLMARNVRSYHDELAGRIRFVQGVPGEIAAAPGGGLEVHHEDSGEGTSSTFDRIVLSVGMVPSPATEEIASLLGSRPGPYGFLEGGGPPVLAAGACTFPKDIPGSMDEAREAAARLATALRPARTVAGVDHG
ncbi:MAG: CoB--CoM heterodisulfide reductase iron-sulfur subunit A family protein [Deltaproteobacteria bacterium]|nr:CoB--CoM heterodisulfide reductase iron-sulfur subunit A family protein [Deltaproteobacteria bacterium]